MTAYQFAKTVNAILEAGGVPKVLPPQMFYTYYKKDFIKVDQRTPEGAAAWTLKYIKKNFPEYAIVPAQPDVIRVESERVEILEITA